MTAPTAVLALLLLTACPARALRPTEDAMEGNLEREKTLVDPVVALFIDALENSFLVKKVDVNLGHTDEDGAPLDPYEVVIPLYASDILYGAMRSGYMAAVGLFGGLGKQFSALHAASKLVQYEMIHLAHDATDTRSKIGKFIADKETHKEEHANKLLIQILKAFFAPNFVGDDTHDSSFADFRTDLHFRPSGVMYGIYTLIEYKSKFSSMFEDKQYKGLSSGEFSVKAAGTKWAYQYITEELSSQIRLAAISLASALTEASRGQGVSAQQYVDGLIHKYGPTIDQEEGFIRGLSPMDKNIYDPATWASWSRHRFVVILRKQTTSEKEKTKMISFADYLKDGTLNALKAKDEGAQLKNWGASILD